MPQPMSLSELSLVCPDIAKRIGQLIEHVSEHFNEALSFGDVIRKIASQARLAASYSSFYLNSFVQTVRSKTLPMATLRYIKDNCPEFFRLLPDLLKDHSTFSSFSSTDDCDPVVMNFIEIFPRDMEAVKEKMAIHAYLFDWLMRSHCAGRGLENTSHASNMPVKSEQVFTEPEHDYSIADMLDFFESRYDSPTTRFMGRCGVGRWLQLRALNAQVQNSKDETASGEYICFDPERKVAYQAVLGLNHLGAIDFELWCASTDEEVALGTHYFFEHSFQRSADSGGITIMASDVRDVFIHTAYVMLLSGSNPVQVFAEIQRRCIAFSDQFEDEPICKHVLEDVFPKMIFYPFRFTWPSLGLTEEDFRGIKAHQLLESKAEYLGRFGGFGVMHMLSYSEQRAFAKVHPSAVASHEPATSPVEEDLPRYVSDVAEFCSLVARDSRQIHGQFLQRAVLAQLNHEIIHAEVSRIIDLGRNEKLKLSQDEWLVQGQVIRVVINRMPQEVLDAMVVESIQQSSPARLDLLLSLRSPSHHLIHALPERHHATVLENDLGL